MKKNRRPASGPGGTPVTCLYILFLLSAVAGTNRAAAQLQIDYAGKVAIGTDTSAYRLTVNGNALFGLSDNTAIGMDDRIKARFGIIKKQGMPTQIVSVAGDPILFSQTDQADIFTNISGATLTERLRIDANGNVAINSAATPDYKLTIGGSGNIFGVANNANFAAKNAAGTFENYFWPRGTDNIMYMNYGSSGLNLRNNAGVSALFIKDNRNIGIGTTDPSSVLTIKGYGSGGTMRVLPSADNGEAGVGFFQKADGSGLQWVISQGGWGNTGNLVFGYDNPKVIIRQNGNVGIGVPLPKVPLEIGISANQTIANFHILDRSGQAVFPDGSKDEKPVSIMASGAVVAARFYAISDRRVKKNLVVSENSTALGIIKQLELTMYHYKDPFQNHLADNTGFIAQQVEQVFPDAVQLSSGFIPDILSSSDTTMLEQGSLVVSLKQPHGLVTGNRVRLITLSGEIREEAVIVRDINAFAIPARGQTAGRIFVYGKEVNDMRSVDYQQLFSLGIGAIQELSKQADELRAENQSLKETLEKLALRVEALEKTNKPATVNP